MTDLLFPLKKLVVINSRYDNLFIKYDKYTELPIKNHPGSFGYERKNHIHEGLDFYCESGDLVHCIEHGVVVSISLFTGPLVGSPWWNTTYCILVEGETGVFNYGEILVNPQLVVGQKVYQGDVLGAVQTVLKKEKGRPKNMLHLELYKHKTQKHIDGWSLGQDKPSNLLDPTVYFFGFAL